MKSNNTFRIKAAFLFVILSCVAGYPVTAQVKTTITLSNSWKFKTESGTDGVGAGWYKPSSQFNDSSWGTIHSGASWESQGYYYAGYAWYRQNIVVPAVSGSAPLQPLQLNFGTSAGIISDDDVWFNGTWVGGLTGAYKYNNRRIRSYAVDKSLIVFGGTNTIAVRVWGGPLGLTGTNNSGLTSTGAYTAVLDPFRVSARNLGKTFTTEVPLQLYDLSFAQNGTTGFSLVFRYPSTLLTPGHTNSLSCNITDFYGTAIATGTSVPVTVSTDNIARGVVNLSGSSAQNIYKAGRFKTALVLKDTTSGATLSSATASMDNLLFAKRDESSLPVATGTVSTPYGSLKVVDQIICSQTVDTHPYMESAFGQHAQDSCTPGAKVSVAVNSITAGVTKSAREITGWGWFAYRIGGGVIVPHKTYLLRIEYPEDTPRYNVVEVQAGHNYMDVGWMNGITSNSFSSYGDFPLSNAWQFYDIMVTAGEETTGGGGVGDDIAQNGFWVYVMNEIKPGSYFSMYSKGPAIATLRLYEIDPAVNAPVITTPPAGIPQRVMTFDWERQVEQNPADMVNYAKLMGYSAISPTILKWTLYNYGVPTNGYYTTNIDQAGYWVENLSTNPASAPIPGPSVHEQYLSVTGTAGINYIPRVEYGGSNLLSSSAHAIANTGSTAAPTRFDPKWCADLVNSATYTDFKAWLDKNIGAYKSTNPQLTGILWRIRGQRMPISYAKADIDSFCRDTSTTEPAGYSSVQLAHWASNTPPEGNATVAASYSNWWLGKRRDFHQKIETLLKSYGSDMALYYFNWDADKFSILAPDITSSDFYNHNNQGGATTAHYLSEGTHRATWTGAQYINAVSSGSFTASGTTWSNRADYALNPSLYTSGSSAGIQLLAPINRLFYANKSDYVSYFKTYDGMAMSNCVSYDELVNREPNPKYECEMMLPGGSAYSMVMELLSYYWGDARTLTYTSYTYGRGFADAHRRFAQAFRALPAIQGTVVSGTPTDVMERTYSTSNGVYVGVAYKGYATTSFSITVPGQAGKHVTNLVTNAAVTATNSGADLKFNMSNVPPMQLNAFLVK